MEQKINKFSELTDNIALETLNLIHSTFDFYFGKNISFKKMPINQISQFINQSFKMKYKIKISLYDKSEIQGHVTIKKDNSTFIFNTGDNVLRIIKIENISYIELI